MKVKLLNRDLIRCFGGVFVEMDESQALKYLKNGNIELLESLNQTKQMIGSRNKMIGSPSKDKMTWTPPEQKMFEHSEFIDLDLNPYPSPNDSLFAQIQ